MKVILHADLKGVGKRNQIVEVADGYARNYLLPRKLAVPATRGGVKTVEKIHQDRAAQEAHLGEQARATATRLAEVTVRITARAGENGRLFGSVTPQQIAEALKQQHRIVVDKHDLHLNEPIRALGLHETTVTLHAELKASLRVEVVSA